MRLPVTLVALLALLAVPTGQARPAKHVVDLKIAILQHGTTREPHPPLGDGGDVFRTTLLLNNTAPAFGRGAKANVGSMIFQYVLHGACSTETCAGATADIVATSRLPGGTIVASENGVKLGRPPIVIPITKGTGDFQGATGSIAVGAASAPFNTYHIILP